MNTAEVFLIAMVIIFSLPYVAWRVGRTEYFAPLVVVQILAGILLGPGILGAAFPGYYSYVFNPSVIQALNGIAWWAVMIFVWLAGVELDLKSANRHRGESALTAGLALTLPLIIGSIVAIGISQFPGWVGSKALPWQFVLGVGMACAVTALPILILFMEKLQIMRQPIGQRILRYASMDDVAIWGVLAIILMDWHRVGRQATFLIAFVVAAYLFRHLMVRIPRRDRWYVSWIWLIACGLSADWSGLHFMVGAFLSGVVLDADWFGVDELDSFRDHILFVMMPVFFLSTGLRTNWAMGGVAVLVVAAALLVASIAGKLAGVHIAGRILNWQPGEASLIGWLLQTKALIMIIFANILLDRAVITSATFTALLLMAVASTMMTVPVVTPKLARLKEIILRTR